MTHKSYFFNRGIWWYAFRQTGWLAVLYWVALTVALPFRLINKENDNNTINEGIFIVNHLYQYDISGDWQTAVLIIFPCLIAVFLTRYMQHRKSNDLFHSLPVKRHHLLSVHLIVGMIMLSVPVWLTGFILWLMRFSLKHIYFGDFQIIQWVICTNVIMLLLFSFTMLIGICIGQSILQILIAGGLLCLPFILSNLFDLHFKMFLYGYVGNNILHDSPAFWSPIYRISNLTYWALEAREVWIYIVWSILFIALSYWLYHARPSESAGTSIVFQYFNPFFRFVMTLTISLTIGILCKGLVASKPVIVIGGYLIGIIIGSVAADMIIRRTWQIVDKHMLKQLGIYGILTSLILFFTISSLNGFVSRIPEKSNIQGVFVGDNLQTNLYSFEKAANGENMAQSLNLNTFSNDPSYIESVMNLHRIFEQMQPNKDVNEQDMYNLGGDQRYIEIAYELKNGELLTRKYSFSFDEYRAYVLPVINQPAYKRSYYSLDELESYPGNIQIVNPDLVRTVNDGIVDVVDNPDEIKELKKLIIDQIENIDDPWHHSVLGNSLDFQIKIPDGPIGSYMMRTYSWDTNNKTLFHWLQSKKLLSTATSMHNIQAIHLLPTVTSNRTGYDEMFEQYKTKVITTKDPVQIKDLLDHSESNYSEVPDSYVLQLEFKSGIKAYRQLRSADITPELYSIVSR